MATWAMPKMRGRGVLVCANAGGAIKQARTKISNSGTGELAAIRERAGRSPRARSAIASRREFNLGRVAENRLLRYHERTMGATRSIAQQPTPGSVFKSRANLIDLLLDTYREHI